MDSLLSRMNYIDISIKLIYIYKYYIYAYAGIVGRFKIGQWVGLNTSLYNLRIFAPIYAFRVFLSFKIQLVTPKLVCRDACPIFMYRNH